MTDNSSKRGTASHLGDDATMKLELDLRVGCAGIDLQVNQQGAVGNTHVNVVRLLSEHPLWRGVIAYDVRAEVAVYKRKPPAFVGRLGSLPLPITDVAQTAMNVWLSHQTGGTDFSDSKLRRAIDLVARGNAFDPVVEYLNSLTWDGTSRLDHWLATYLGVEPSVFTRSVGPKFLIGAVARALRPGCKVDHVLVLEGEQGLGKTTALQILAGEYHRGDLPPLDSKDVKEALRGAWIIELGELASMNKSELTAAKNFLTLTNDNYRVPYGIRSETHPRRFVMAGSTNEREWMQDQTGNRRLWPVLCTAIDLCALARDRDQLWAEAFVRFNRGEPWHLGDAQEIEAAKLEQEKRREVDPWEERVARFVCAHRDCVRRAIVATDSAAS
ncbi:MAG: virulence-associated protein [Myxococcaceae bacterium]|nr:virulence-associated protein [Myxococcaceae bacterium]